MGCGREGARPRAVGVRGGVERFAGGVKGSEIGWRKQQGEDWPPLADILRIRISIPGVYHPPTPAHPVGACRHGAARWAAWPAPGELAV